MQQQPGWHFLNLCYEGPLEKCYRDSVFSPKGSYRRTRIIAERHLKRQLRTYDLVAQSGSIQGLFTDPQGRRKPKASKSGLCVFFGWAELSQEPMLRSKGKSHRVPHRTLFICEVFSATPICGPCMEVGD